MLSQVSLSRQAGKCPRPREHKLPSGRVVSMRCHSRRCESCGVLWAGDARRKLLVNIEAYGGAVAVVTITAPGVEVLPWDEQHCAHLGKHQHSGKLGCRVQETHAHDFNVAAPESWRRMHRTARQRAARRARAAGGKWAAIAMQWEFQHRGVLHRHVVVPMATPLERICSQIYAQALQDLSRAHGWGNVDCGRRTRAGSVWSRMLRVVPEGQAARYLAKYLAAVDSKAGKIRISETVTHKDVPGHISFVSRRLTRRTGCTMRSLRETRRLYVRSIAHADPLTPELTRALLQRCLADNIAAGNDQLVAAIRHAMAP